MRQLEMDEIVDGQELDFLGHEKEGYIAMHVETGTDVLVEQINARRFKIVKIFGGWETRLDHIADIADIADIDKATD